MTELLIAAYAAETSSHVVAVPRDERFRSFARGFDERAYLEGLAPLGIRWLPRTDRDFPHGLAAIFDPPAGLFLRGEGPVKLLDEPAVAVVGARSCSSYGAQVARMLGRELAAAGLLVVSGMARGIDGEAHRGALEASGGTVAVLGCGVDRSYPAAHSDLARRICERGLLVSEYAPGVEPAPWRFPARKGKSPAAVRVSLNHALRIRPQRRWVTSSCGPGVVSVVAPSRSSLSTRRGQRLGRLLPGRPLRRPDDE